MRPLSHSWYPSGTRSQSGQAKYLSWLTSLENDTFSKSKGVSHVQQKSPLTLVSRSILEWEVSLWEWFCISGSYYYNNQRFLIMMYVFRHQMRTQNHLVGFHQQTSAFSSGTEDVISIVWIFIQKRFVHCGWTNCSTNPNRHVTSKTKWPVAFRTPDPLSIDTLVNDLRALIIHIASHA